MKCSTLPVAYWRLLIGDVTSCAKPTSLRGRWLENLVCNFAQLFSGRTVDTVYSQTGSDWPHGEHTRQTFRVSWRCGHEFKATVRCLACFQPRSRSLL